jgi:hypothetical protein
MVPTETADRCPSRPEPGYTNARESLLPGGSLPVDYATNHEFLPWEANLDHLRLERSRFHPPLGWVIGLLIVGAIIVLLAGWVGYMLLEHYDVGHESRARVDCAILSAQVETWKINNGQYPTSIEQLAQQQPNGAALVKPEMVIDPWGKRYQIDPTGQHNGGLRADVFTTTPRGVLVGNFSK